MPDGPWVCDGCNTNNAADSGICRRCQRAAGSTTSSEVHVLSATDRQPRRSTEGNQSGFPAEFQPGFRSNSAGMQLGGSSFPRGAHLGSGGGDTDAGTRAAASSTLYPPAPPKVTAPPLPMAGTEPSPRRTGWWWLLGVAVIALAVVLGRLSVSAPASPESAGTQSAPGTVETASPAPAPPPPTPDQSLAAALAADRSTVESVLLDHWVPQLASNTPGADVNVPGRYWDMASIWEEHHRLQQQFGALLYKSEDYVSQRAGYWVSVAPVTFSDPEGALSWCAAQGLDGDHCYAKFVTHDYSVGRTAVHPK